MLNLTDSRWSHLTHAYGSATDIPALLKQLEEDAGSAPGGEPWFSLWSALAHQGDVYPASFAAVPHIVRLIAEFPQQVTSTYFHFVAWIEICRRKTDVAVQPELLHAYEEALASLPKLVSDIANREWDRDLVRGALAAIAVAKADTQVAEAILELSDDLLPDFFEWQKSR